MIRVFTFLLLSYSTIHCAENLVIIGGGPAGLSSAIWAARFNLNPIVIEGPSDEDPLSFLVENYPGFPDGIDRQELIETLTEQAIKSGATIKQGWVSNLDLSPPFFTLTLESEETLSTKALVLATGRSKQKLNLEGEKALMGRGIGYCAYCEGPLYQGKKVVVYGKGKEALEQASLLSLWVKSLIVITEDSQFDVPYSIMKPLESNPRIQFIYKTKITELSGLEKGELTGVFTKSVSSDLSTYIPSEGLFIALGSIPNSQLVQESLALNPEGYILTNGKGSATSVPGVFAAGDVADPLYHQFIFAAASGCRAAAEAREFITREHSDHETSVSAFSNPPIAFRKDCHPER